MNTHRVGRRFESLAEARLVASGWTTLDRNVRYGRKEIDLVVRRGDLVAFVEVKGRRGAECGDPLEAVTGRKRREIEAVARWWVERFGRPGDLFRFDVVAVRAAGGRVTTEHVEDAWRVGE